MEQQAARLEQGTWGRREAGLWEARTPWHCTPRLVGAEHPGNLGLAELRCLVNVGSHFMSLSLDSLILKIGWTLA